MARKRGGLAGLWDRNKGAIKAIAPIAAGAFGGPMAGAAVGAAMRGLDRPGKSGIGFDISEGIQGGLEGYGQGSLGKSISGGMKGLFTPGAAAKAPTTSPAFDMTGQGIGAPISSAPPPARIGPNMPNFWEKEFVNPPSFGSRIKDLLTSKEGLAGLSQFASAGASILGSQRQADLEQERMDREQREAEARAQLMALFAPQMLSAYDRFGAGA